jgi:C_GCAxxG_C_C family probable redox protein
MAESDPAIERCAARAVELFSPEAYYCSEALLLSVAEHAGILAPHIPRIASGFGSGFSRTRGLCGAVTGGVLAIGLVAGRPSPGADVESCYDLVREFLAGFGQRFGSTNCPDLCGCDLGSPEGKAKFRAEKKFLQCRELVREAVRLLLPLLHPWL